MRAERSTDTMLKLLGSKSLILHRKRHPPMPTPSASSYEKGPLICGPESDD